MNRLGTRQAGGPLVVEGTTDEPATVTINGRPAVTDGANGFRGTMPTSSGTTMFSVVARDGSGNQTTKQYEVDVAGTATSYTHDANGNLTSDGTKTYEWNALDQLVRVTQGATELATFAYDGAGRRVQKTAGGVTRTYVFDAEDIVEERVSTGDVIRYVHGPGIDDVLARTTNGANATGYVADHLGSIVQETNAAGQATLTREYDPWGEPVQGAAVGGYAFTGREWDAEQSLYYYRARYYDAHAGRFVSGDPSGFIDGPNAYAYVHGGPVGRVDPDGRFAIAIPAYIAGVLIYAAAGAVIGIFAGLAASKSQKEVRDREMLEKRFVDEQKRIENLTSDDKKKLQERQRQFPREERPEDALEDLEATQAGFRKGGRNQVDNTGKSKQKVDRCP